MPIQSVRGDHFDQEVLAQPGWALVDFYADWCGPCRALAPLMEQLATELEGRVRFYQLDVDAEEEIAERYSIRTIPTLIAFRDGELKAQAVNPRSRSTIEALFQE